MFACSFLCDKIYKMLIKGRQLLLVAGTVWTGSGWCWLLVQCGQGQVGVGCWYSVDRVRLVLVAGTVWTGSDWCWLLVQCGQGQVVVVCWYSVNFLN